MSFPERVKDEAYAKCGRRCCICHKFCGKKMELHHIVQKAYGGDDSMDNAIPLCFDCHADMGKADPKHPKGKHYSARELRMHRDNWYEIVAKGGVYNASGGSDYSINITDVKMQLDLPVESDGRGGFKHGSRGEFTLEIINREGQNIIFENIHCGIYQDTLLVQNDVLCTDKSTMKKIAMAPTYLGNL